MAKVRKVVLRTGVYHTRQGKLKVTPQKMGRWARLGNEMLQAGIRIPACWGHQLSAFPGKENELAKRQYNLAKANAGYILSFDHDPNTDEFALIMDLPGCEVDKDGNLLSWHKLEDGSMVKSAIKEVSVAIKEYKDGSGREWPESIIHVALTPHPVMTNQDGFRDAARSDIPMCLSLSQMFYELADTSAVDGGDDLTKALSFLKDKGINLPPSENPNDVVKHLALASHFAGDSSGATTVSADDDDLDPDKIADELEMGDEDEDDEDEDDDDDVIEEKRPVSMSVMSDREKALFVKAQTAARRNRLYRVARLKKHLPKPKFDKLVEAARGYELSLDEACNEVEQKLDIQLSAMEEVWGDGTVVKPKKKKVVTEAQRTERYVHDSQKPHVLEAAKEAAARYSMKR